MSERDDERRRADRRSVFTGAQIQVDGGEARIAITEDASETGLLLLTRAHLEVGQSVRVSLHLRGSDAVHVVSGRVVRREKVTADESGLWREKVAVAFDERIPAVAEMLREASERQAAVYGTKG